MPRQPEIIECFFANNKEAVLEALRKNPSSINDLHKGSRWNVVMLAIHERSPLYIDALVEIAGDKLDFEHLEVLGNDLMVLALNTGHRETIQAVQRAYEKHARHIIGFLPDEFEPEL